MVLKWIFLPKHFYNSTRPVRQSPWAELLDRDVAALMMMVTSISRLTWPYYVPLNVNYSCLSSWLRRSWADVDVKEKEEDERRPSLVKMNLHTDLDMDLSLSLSLSLSLIHSRTQTKLVRGTPTHKHSYLEMALSLPLSYLQAHTNSN